MKKELMGSLMAGWNSNFKDPKAVICQRNKSLTKEEIAAYWKSKVTEDVNNENQKNMHKGSLQRTQRSNSMPLVDRKERSLNSDGPEGEKLSKTNCWWTRSNWAFLNEPPVITTEGHQKYAAQFNAAQFGSSKICT